MTKLALLALLALCSLSFAHPLCDVDIESIVKLPEPLPSEILEELTLRPEFMTLEYPPCAVWSRRGGYYESHNVGLKALEGMMYSMGYIGGPIIDSSLLNLMADTFGHDNDHLNSFIYFHANAPIIDDYFLVESYSHPDYVLVLYPQK